jgi:hypothetical protein
MLTRGRHANHLYLQAVGDGDPHTLIRPETISPRTPTETLQQILTRDEAPSSASTMLRELNDPEARLFQAVQRYTDGLHVAAEQLLGHRAVAELDQADQYIPGLTTEPAWPTLRAQLLAVAAETDEHPLHHLLTAASGRDLRTAGDMAAVLDWRLTAVMPFDPGPLPWLPGIPPTLRSHPVWGPIWPSDSNWSPTWRIMSKTTPARQPGLHREVTRAPPSSAKSQCGGPPTAPIPRTRDQPEEPNSKRSRSCGNNASTGISRVPPTPQQMRRPMSGRQHTPHLDAGTTTGSAHTNNPDGVPAARPRPADSASQSDRAARNVRRLHKWAGRMASASHAEPRPGIRFPPRRCGSARAARPRRTTWRRQDLPPVQSPCVAAIWPLAHPPARTISARAQIRCIRSAG